jgi:hypothetical protein
MSKRECRGRLSIYHAVASSMTWAMAPDVADAARTTVSEVSASIIETADAETAVRPGVVMVLP